MQPFVIHQVLACSLTAGILSLPIPGSTSSLYHSWFNQLREKVSSLLKHGFSSDESLSTFPSPMQGTFDNASYSLMIYPIIPSTKLSASMHTCSNFTCIPLVLKALPSITCRRESVRNEFLGSTPEPLIRNSLGVRVQAILKHTKVWDPIVSPQRGMLPMLVLFALPTCFTL